MPLIRIDTIEGQYDEQKRTVISDVLYDAVQTIGAPDGDRFQIFAQHRPGDHVFDRSYLGIERSDGVIAIQITMNTGRTLDQKKGLFAFIATQLAERAHIRQEDVFVNLIEVPRENWSFGNGEAQYAPAE